MPRRPRAAPPVARTAKIAAAIDYHAILECAVDVVFTIDLDTCLTYFNARALEVLGYHRSEAEQFLGRPVMDVLAPEGTASAIEAMRRRADSALSPQVYRLEARHKDGSPVRLEVHSGPLIRDGALVGRVGIGRVLHEASRGDALAPDSNIDQLLQAERIRIARGLRDATAQVVFGITAEGDATESFLLDVKRAGQADLARRLRLDDVDFEVVRLIVAGASNPEIGVQVHLSAAAIKDRVRRLVDRLGARRRSELAAHALRLGIV